MTNHPNRSSMSELTGEKLAKEPLPFRARFMCMTGGNGLPVYYAQVFAGYGAGQTFPTTPIWQSKVRRNISPSGWPAEAQRVADEACAKLLARRAEATKHHADIPRSGEYWTDGNRRIYKD